MFEATLLRVLREGSVQRVQQLLEREPIALENAFFDGNFEPALCFAVRHRASGAIIDTLLQHGADVHAMDLHGNTAAVLVSQSFHTATFAGWLDGEVASCNWTLRVAKSLLRAGVNPDAPCGHRRTLAEIARKTGNLRLADFWEFCQMKTASLVLNRALHSQTTHSSLHGLSPELLQNILGLLLPEKMASILIC